MRAHISIAGLSTEGLLEDWRWLFPDSCSIIAMNQFGDMFLCNDKGEIYFLDIIKGEANKIADSVAELEVLLLDKEVEASLFLTELLTELEREGITLAEGQCFSFRIPPVLGGKMESSNVEVCSISVHVSLVGQILRQVRHLAPGTKVGPFRIE